MVPIDHEELSRRRVVTSASVEALIERGRQAAEEHSAIAHSSAEESRQLASELREVCRLTMPVGRPAAMPLDTSVRTLETIQALEASFVPLEQQLSALSAPVVRPRKVYGGAQAVEEGKKRAVYSKVPPRVYLDTLEAGSPEPNGATPGSRRPRHVGRRPHRLAPSGSAPALLHAPKDVLALVAPPRMRQPAAASPDLPSAKAIRRDGLTPGQRALGAEGVADTHAACRPLMERGYSILPPPNRSLRATRRVETEAAAAAAERKRLERRWRAAERTLLRDSPGGRVRPRAAAPTTPERHAAPPSASAAVTAVTAGTAAATFAPAAFASTAFAAATLPPATLAPSAGAASAGSASGGSAGAAAPADAPPVNIVVSLPCSSRRDSASSASTSAPPSPACCYTPAMPYLPGRGSAPSSLGDSFCAGCAPWPSSHSFSLSSPEPQASPVGCGARPAASLSQPQRSGTNGVAPPRGQRAPPASVLGASGAAIRSPRLSPMPSSKPAVARTPAAPPLGSTACSTRSHRELHGGASSLAAARGAATGASYPAYR